MAEISKKDVQKYGKIILGMEDRIERAINRHDRKATDLWLGKLKKMAKIGFTGEIANLEEE